MKWILLIITLGLVSYGSVDKESIHEKVTYIEKPIKYAHESVEALDKLYFNIINPVIRHFGKVFISDLYRCDYRSQHYKHQAVDFDFDLVDSASNRDLYEFVRDSLDYDQLIIYTSISKPSHVHVSWKPKGNRAEKLFKVGRYYKRLN